jgi:hypothetical protein
MLNCNSLICPLAAACSIAVSFCGFTATAVFAQEQKGNREDTELPFIKQKERITKLVSGEEQPDSVKDKDLLGVISRHYISRVTWQTIQSEKWDSNTGMGKLHADLEKLMNDPATKDGKNKDFMKQLAHQFVERLKEVLGQKLEGNTTAVTNAALMLPVVAKCRQGEINDYLLELAKADEKGNAAVHPFIRMCAIKGLGEMNAPGGPPVDGGNDDKTKSQKSRRELDRLDAIVKFIDTPYPPQGTGQEYDDAMAFARREGIKALAQIQVPAYEIDKGKAVKGPVAWYLFNIASGVPPKVGPPFTVSEKLEAALGICHLKSGHNAELATYLVGDALVELGRAYAEDYAYFSVKVGKEEPKRQPRLPWKIYAQRFQAGLQAMQNNSAKDSAADKKVKSLVAGSKKLLDDISGYRPVELEVFQQEVTAMRPQNADVYPGIKGFTLSPSTK